MDEVLLVDATGPVLAEVADEGGHIVAAGAELKAGGGRLLLHLDADRAGGLEGLGVGVVALGEVDDLEVAQFLQEGVDGGRIGLHLLAAFGLDVPLAVGLREVVGDGLAALGQGGGQADLDLDGAVRIDAQDVLVAEVGGALVEFEEIALLDRHDGLRVADADVDRLPFQVGPAAEGQDDGLFGFGVRFLLFARFAFFLAFLRLVLGLFLGVLAVRGLGDEGDGEARFGQAVACEVVDAVADEVGGHEAEGGAEQGGDGVGVGAGAGLGQDPAFGIAFGAVESDGALFAGQFHADHVVAHQVHEVAVAVRVEAFADAVVEVGRFEDEDVPLAVQADVQAAADDRGAADVDRHGPGFGILLALALQGQAVGGRVQFQVLEGGLALGAGFDDVPVLALQGAAEEPADLVLVGGAGDGFGQPPLVLGGAGDGEFGGQGAVGAGLLEGGLGDVIGREVLDERLGGRGLGRRGRFAGQVVMIEVDDDDGREHDEGQDEGGGVTHRFLTPSESRTAPAPGRADLRSAG